MILLVLACAPDACDAMCDAGLGRYEACMEERGLDWGLAYRDEVDWRNWCDTVSWEWRRLDEADRCEANLRTFAEGTCEEYDAAWSSSN